jgi:proteic killer suppression protein
MRGQGLLPLKQLEIAGRLDDLRIPPGNRLCFIWSDAGPEAVELVDYY